MATLLEILRDSTAKWTRRPPVSEAAIEALIATCDFKLPEEYLAFLRYSNGGEGFLCIEPWYFQLCSAEEVIEYNHGYHVEEFLPGWFAIGSNGGGDMLAIRKRDGSPCPVYMVPFIPMAESDAVQITHDFEMFAMALVGRHNKKVKPAGTAVLVFRMSASLQAAPRSLTEHLTVKERMTGYELSPDQVAYLVRVASRHHRKQLAG